VHSTVPTRARRSWTSGWRSVAPLSLEILHTRPYAIRPRAELSRECKRSARRSWSALFGWAALPIAGRVQLALPGKRESSACKSSSTMLEARGASSRRVLGRRSFSKRVAPPANAARLRRDARLWRLMGTRDGLALGIVARAGSHGGQGRFPREGQSVTARLARTAGESSLAHNRRSKESQLSNLMQPSGTLRARYDATTRRAPRPISRSFDI